MRLFYIAMIPGVMVGFEWDYINKFLVFDFLIIRVVVDYFPDRDLSEGASDE